MHVGVTANHVYKSCGQHWRGRASPRSAHLGRSPECGSRSRSPTPSGHSTPPVNASSRHHSPAYRECFSQAHSMPPPANELKWCLWSLPCMHKVPQGKSIPSARLQSRRHRWSVSTGCRIISLTLHTAILTFFGPMMAKVLSPLGETFTRPEPVRGAVPTKKTCWALTQRVSSGVSPSGNSWGMGAVPGKRVKRQRWDIRSHSTSLQPTDPNVYSPLKQGKIGDKAPRRLRKISVPG
jgi:hypothetical protein